MTSALRAFGQTGAFSGAHTPTLSIRMMVHCHLIDIGSALSVDNGSALYVDNGFALSAYNGSALDYIIIYIYRLV